MVIATERELAAWCERLAHASIVCLDTEFAGEGRYFPELGTIQIASGDQAALLDPLAVRDLSLFFPILADPKVLKVLHAGEQDLDIFYRLSGRPVSPVFDTQIAAALLGYGDQISFRSLAESTTGVQLEKSYTFTDWLRRPLSKNQVEYALDDVRYLGQVHARLEQQLAAKNRLEWAREEFSQLEHSERYQPLDERQLYSRLKGAERLSSHALGILQELAAWREQTARRLNMPPGRIVMDPVLMELARRPRKSVRELAEVRGLNARQIEKFGTGIIDAMRLGERNTLPPIKRAAGLPRGLEPTVDFLSLCLRAISVEQSISTGILGNRNDLTLLAAFGERADTPLLRGWRRQAAGMAMLSALHGKVVARITPETRAVHLEWQRLGSGTR